MKFVFEAENADDLRKKLSKAIGPTILETVPLSGTLEAAVRYIQDIDVADVQSEVDSLSYRLQDIESSVDRATDTIQELRELALTDHAALIHELTTRLINLVVSEDSYPKDVDDREYIEYPLITKALAEIKTQVNHWIWQDQEDRRNEINAYLERKDVYLHGLTTKNIRKAQDVVDIAQAYAEEAALEAGADEEA